MAEADLATEMDFVTASAFENPEGAYTLSGGTYAVTLTNTGTASTGYSCWGTAVVNSGDSLDGSVKTLSDDGEIRACNGEDVEENEAFSDEQESEATEEPAGEPAEEFSIDDNTATPTDISYERESESDADQEAGVDQDDTGSVDKGGELPITE